MPETLVLAFDGKATYSFGRTEEHSFSVFGGPMDYNITGKKSYRLHQIARLSNNQLPALDAPSYVFDLPLVYGMCYDGGNLTYRFEHNAITILDGPGKLIDDWPYKYYPAILPYLPLAVKRRQKQTWRQFAGEFPNLTEDQPSDLIVLIPPPMTIGVSLWGREGDAEGVTIVFKCDLGTKKVAAYNVCT